MRVRDDRDHAAAGGTLMLGAAETKIAVFVADAGGDCPTPRGYALLSISPSLSII